MHPLLQTGPYGFLMPVTEAPITTIILEFTHALLTLAKLDYK
jgi:hypothetical protein